MCLTSDYSQTSDYAHAPVAVFILMCTHVFQGELHVGSKGQHRWEPSKLITNGTYTRVNMRALRYCAKGAVMHAGEVQSNSAPLLEPAAQTCDFPEQQLHKAGHRSAQYKMPDAWFFMQKLSISFEGMTDLLTVEEHGDDGASDDWKAACTYLKSHQDKWEPWLPPNSHKWTRVWIALSVLFIVLCGLLKHQVMHWRNANLGITPGFAAQTVAKVIGKVEDTVWSAEAVLEDAATSSAHAVASAAGTLTGSSKDMLKNFTRCSSNLHLSLSTRATTVLSMVDDVKDVWSREWEDDGTITIELQRDHLHATSQKLPRLTVTVKAVNGTARENTDFQLLDDKVTFEDGVKLASIKVKLLKTTVYKPTTDFSITILESPNFVLKETHRSTTLHVHSDVTFPLNFDFAGLTDRFRDRVRLLQCFFLETARSDMSADFVSGKQNWVRIGQLHLGEIVFAAYDTLVFSLMTESFINDTLNKGYHDTAVLFSVVAVTAEALRYYFRCTLFRSCQGH